MIGTRPGALAKLVALTLFASGCTTVGMTPTPRSSIEQRLITRSLERAAADLDTSALANRTVRLELYGMTPDQVFAREFLRAQLEARGLRVVAAGEADVVLKVFATALAVDEASTLLGLPATQAPVLAVPIPEIALFKWDRNRGHAQLQSFVYDAEGRLLARRPEVLGQAKYDRFTVLLFVSFAITDLDDPPDSGE